jgi:ketosteroid isomerase-like protein
MTDAEVNKDLVARFIQAQSDGDLAQAWSMLDPEGTWWVLTERRLIGISEYTELWDRLITKQFPFGLKLTILDMVAECDKVAVRAESNGMTRDGLHYNNIYFFQFQIAADRIVSAWEHSDTDHVWQVLRAGMPRPATVGKRMEDPQ